MKSAAGANEGTHCDSSDFSIARRRRAAFARARRRELHHPTPIQAQAIPLILAGRDVLGLAQTGTGKTAAFGLPLLQQLPQNGMRVAPQSARALILAPTRELAIQIHDSLKIYGRHLKLRHAVILGGVNQNKQIAAMRRGVDILVATPGRLLDLVNQKHVRLGHGDHARHRRSRPHVRHGLHPRRAQDRRHAAAAAPFACCSPPPCRTKSRIWSREILHDPARIDVSPAKLTADRIDQQRPFRGRGGQARAAGRASRTIRRWSASSCSPAPSTAPTRSRATLAHAGHAAAAIHGNKSQNARQAALEDFRAGRARILVATDIAARGIDVDDVTHVVNFELPDVAESYVHRIGRTARAGAGGIAISFCEPEERDNLRAIERLVKAPLTVIGDMPPVSAKPAPRQIDYAKPRNKNRRFKPKRNDRRAA